MPRLALAFFLAVPVVAGSCGAPSDSGKGGSTDRNGGQVGVRDSVEELQGLIRLESEPEEVVFSVQKLDAEAAKKIARPVGSSRLIAVLRYEEGSDAALSEALKREGEGQPISMDIETWFPAEIVAQGQTSSDSTVRGRAFSAKALLAAPYSDGRVVAIEGSRFYVIEMFGS